MEESLNITIHDIEPRVKEFIELPAGHLKNLQYYKNIQSVPIRRTNLLKREGNLYFSSLALLSFGFLAFSTKDEATMR